MVLLALAGGVPGWPESKEALLRLAVMVIGVLLTASVILLVLTLTILFRRNIIIRKL